MRFNPPAALLGREHAVLNGVGRAHAVRGFAAPLSIKTVVRGSALWRTAGGEWRLGPGRFLVVNGGQTYDVEIESHEPVETFCIFFRAGFAAEVAHGVRTPGDVLLDRPAADDEPGFIETIEPLGPRMAALLADAGRRARRGEDATDSLVALVETLVAKDGDVRRLGDQAAAARAATREEILRRVLRGRDRIESAWSERLTLSDIARAAGMAPHHFHRCFRALFGATPHEYLTRRRVDEALRRLRSGDEPLQDVCLAVGFESLPTFVHRIRRATGLTPGRYRAAFRKIG